jgi:predicted amidohydrolase
MIINPWGEIEQVITTGEGYVSVNYQPEELTRIRNNMPLKSPLTQPLKIN